MGVTTKRLVMAGWKPPKTYMLFGVNLLLQSPLIMDIRFPQAQPIVALVMHLCRVPEEVMLAALGVRATDRKSVEATTGVGSWAGSQTRVHSNNRPTRGETMDKSLVRASDVAVFKNL